MCRFASPEPGIVWLLEGAEAQPPQERQALQVCFPAGGFPTCFWPLLMDNFSITPAYVWDS